MGFPDEDALQPQLERATTTLKTALETACGADIDDADTGELIKIEEVLAIANEAAKEAVSVRRRLRSDSKRTHAGRREVEDGRGIRWLVFAVYPSSPSGRSTLNERFRGGWLSFDCGMETRRLAPIPAGWDALTDEELVALCETAEVAPRRVRPSTPPGVEGGTASGPTGGPAGGAAPPP
jgi:hypothetical protein